MGYSSLISGIMNNNALLHSFFYFNFAESGEMNGNARGIGNTGSANGKSNSSNGGGSGSAGIPKEARLDYEAEEKQVNTLDYLDNLNYVATEFVQQAPVLSYCYDASKNINNGEYLQAGINFLSGVGDAILFFGTLGTATLATTTGKQLMKQGGKMGVKNIVPRAKSVLGHIFRDSPGHVNPSTLSSKNRYIKLFENVANNPNNINTKVLADYQRNTVGFLGYSKTFQNGRQVWVQVYNNKIINAGVNIIPK